MEQGFNILCVYIFHCLLCGKLVAPSCQNGCVYFGDEGRRAFYRKELSSEGDKIKLHVTVQKPGAVAYDVISGDFYAIDVGGVRSTSQKYVIRAYDVTTSKAELPLSSYPVSLAVDPLSRLVYYSDTYNDVIGVYSSDLHYHHLVVSEGTKHPYGLAVDPVNGTLYWIDSSPNDQLQIKKSHMDGTEPHIIISENIQTPMGLSYDIKEGLLYWCDRGRDVIERSHGDGSNRQVVHHLDDDSQCFGIAVDDHFIYWTQSNKIYIQRIYKNGTGPVVRLLDEGSRIRYTGIALTTIQYHNVSNACSVPTHGGCEHLCIPTPQSRVCRCSDGFILHADGTSCKKLEFEAGLMVVDSHWKEVFVLDLLANASVALNLTGQKWSRYGHLTPTAVVYDEKNKFVFWTDSAKKGVFRSCFPNSCNVHYVHQPTRSSELVGLAIDKDKKQVYIVDQGLRHIVRKPYSGGEERFLRIVSHAELLTSIVLDTQQRTMYWAVQGTNSRIEVASMESEHTVTEHKVFLHLREPPQALAIDISGRMLYWTYKNSGKLDSIHLDTMERKLILNSVQGVVSAISFGGGCLFWALEEEKTIRGLTLTKDAPTVHTFGSTQFRHIISITYFSGDDGRIWQNGTWRSNWTFPDQQTDAPADIPIVVGSVVGVAIVVIIIAVILRTTCTKRKVSCDRSMRMTPTEVEMAPLDTPQQSSPRWRSPALRPPEAMVNRPLPEVPPGGFTPSGDAPAEAGFREFLLRQMSTPNGDTYSGLKQAERDMNNLLPPYQH